MTEPQETDTLSRLESIPMNNTLPAECRVDFHIHTHYLGCADSTMRIPDILEECRRLGATSIALTDHLNSPDQLPLHRAILQELLSLPSGLDVYFGVELNFTGRDGGFVFDPDIKREYGFQFAIGGIHEVYTREYDLERIVSIQHRHHLKTCRDPLVDVLVHPYWFHWNFFEQAGWPWFDSMKAVPERYVRELGQTARETGTAIEINASANLCNPRYNDSYVREYLDFLAVLAQEGACFSLGSDAHGIGKLECVTTAWSVAARLGIPPERIWRPSVSGVKPLHLH